MRKVLSFVLIMVGVIIVITVLVFTLKEKETNNLEDMYIVKMNPEPTIRVTVSEAKDIRLLQEILRKGRRVIPHPDDFVVTSNGDGTCNFPVTKAGGSIYNIYEKLNGQDVEYTVSSQRMIVKYIENDVIIAEICYEFDTESFLKISDMTDRLEME